MCWWCLQCEEGEKKRKEKEEERKRRKTTGGAAAQNMPMDASEVDWALTADNKLSDVTIFIVEEDDEGPAEDSGRELGSECETRLLFGCSEPEESTDDEMPGLLDQDSEESEFGDDAGAEDYLGTGPKEAPYTRVESSLLTAFPGFAKLMDPAGDGGKDRYFELRTYENPNERAAALKVEMFGKGGEIAVFDEVGLKSVFYGSARIAQNLPQLTYMVVHENEDAAKQAWSGFGKSPSWAKLKKVQRYKGTVSKIYKHMLVALPFSELK